MRSYSLGRVLQYTRYHYTVQQSKYMTRLLILAGLPLLIGVLDSSVTAAVELMSFLYFFASFGFASLSVYPMRDRGLRVLEMAVPVSNCERMTFFLFNLGVIYPLVVHVLGIVVALFISLLDSGVSSLAQTMAMVFDNGFGDWWLYVTCQLFASGALLINLLARRNLFVAYLIAFFSFIALFSCVGWALGTMSEMGIIHDNMIYISPQMFEDVIEPIIKWIYSLLPAIIYAICYTVLRKRQLKW